MQSSTKPHSLQIVTLSLLMSQTHRAALKKLDATAFGADSAWRDVEFDSQLEGKFDVSVLASISDQVAGFAIASRSSGNSIHIHRIAVDPVFRGQKIGRLLVSAIEERAISTGADRVSLEFPETLAIRGFYDSLGYKQVSTSDVHAYLKSKNKENQESLYLPLPHPQRFVYSKAVSVEHVVACEPCRRS